MSGMERGELLGRVAVWVWEAVVCAVVGVLFALMFFISL